MSTNHQARWLAALAIVLLIPLPPTPVAGQSPQALALAPRVQAWASPEKNSIIRTVATFFQASDAGDGALFVTVTHPEARGWMEDAGELDFKAWTAYAEGLRNPAKKPAHAHLRTPTPRTITDLAHYGGLATAVVQWRPSLTPGPATGPTSVWALQLLRAETGWTIVSVAAYDDRLEGQADARVLDAMGIRPGMTVGEIGAGDGRFTVPIARRVGSGGKVYANDIRAGALDSLRARCSRLGLGQVETILGKVDDPLMPPNALDAVAMVWVYHHLDEPVALLRNLAPALKPGATVAILDPAYDRTGETDSDRPSTKELVAREAAAAGFELVRVETFLPMDNIFILRLRKLP